MVVINHMTTRCCLTGKHGRVMSRTDLPHCLVWNMLVPDESENLYYGRCWSTIVPMVCIIENTPYSLTY